MAPVMMTPHLRAVRLGCYVRVVRSSCVIPLLIQSSDVGSAVSGGLGAPAVLAVHIRLDWEAQGRPAHHRHAQAQSTHMHKPTWEF